MISNSDHKKVALNKPKPSELRKQNKKDNIFTKAKKHDRTYRGTTLKELETVPSECEQLPIHNSHYFCVNDPKT